MPNTARTVVNATKMPAFQVIVVFIRRTWSLHMLRTSTEKLGTWRLIVKQVCRWCTRVLLVC